MDSGIGGLSYLERARELLQDEFFIYLAVTAGFPYGLKDSSTIRDIVLDRVDRLRRHWDPKCLVIACNTASQVALHAIRMSNPDLPVIGTVPAIKPAAASSVTRIIGVLATDRTVRDPYLDRLIENFGRECTVLRCEAGGLVEFIEKRYCDSNEEERISVVESYISGLVNEGVDRIVLACTHFLHVAGEIEEVCRRMSSSIVVVDSREGVARRLVHVLRESAPRAETTIPGTGILLVSAAGAYEDGEGSYSAWASRFGLSGPYLLDS